MLFREDEDSDMQSIHLSAVQREIQTIKEKFTVKWLLKNFGTLALVMYHRSKAYGMSLDLNKLPNTSFNALMSVVNEREGTTSNSFRENATNEECAQMFLANIELALKNCSSPSSAGADLRKSYQFL